MVKIRLTKVNRGIMFEVLEQDERLRKDSMKSYTAPNGISFAVSCQPEIDTTVNTVYLRGTHHHKDDAPTLALFKNNEERDKFMIGIEEAFVDFKKFLKETYGDKKEVVDEYTKSMILSAYDEE